MKMHTKFIDLFFPGAKEDIANGKCPLCKDKISLDEFKDELSVKEYHISGMCQECQDKVFK
jgi:hypothetical protein